MATIEERAKQLVTDIIEDCIDFGSRDVLIGRMDEYVTNALAKQQELDIQRAKETYCNICGESCILASYCEDMQRLEKAMKGE